MRFLVFLLFLSSPLSVKAQAPTEPLIVIMSDFDGSFTQIGADHWISSVHLTRIGNYRDNSFFAISAALKKKGLSFDDLPYELEITQEEDLFYRDLFNKKNGAIPRYDTMTLKPIPGLLGRDKETVIIPGIYKMEYRATFNDNSELLSDYRRAKKTQGKNFKESFGLGLDIINANISKPSAQISIHTARTQSPETFLKLFSMMKRDKLISASGRLLDGIKIFSLGRPESSRYGAEFSKRKVNLLEQEIKSLVPILSANPLKNIHVVVLEDELNYTYDLNKLFERISKRALLNTNSFFHIFFTGPTELAEELEQQKGNRFVTYRNGTVSPTSQEHLKLLGLPADTEKVMNEKMKDLHKGISECRKTFLLGA